MKYTLLLSIAMLFPAAFAGAELTLHPLFSDHAVLQADKPLPVWGTAAPRAEVTVTLGHARPETVTAGPDGRWMVILEAKEPTHNPQTLTVRSGDEILERTNLLCGEVWLCTGQSNMAMGLRNTDLAAQVYEEAAAGKFKSIRLFNVPAQGEDKPQTTVDARWTLSEEKTLASFSATGTYFARSLRQRGLDSPIGLIKACSGGTNVYSWIPTRTFTTDPVASVARRWWQTQLRSGDAALAAHEKRLAEWQKKRADLLASKAGPEELAKLGRAPREPMHAGHYKRPTALYNGTIAPLQPYAIRGAIWYQGEANSRAPWVTSYADFLGAMVRAWRADWTTRAGGNARKPDRFPFYAVQLPAFANGDPEGWPLIREEFARLASQDSRIEYAVTLDSGDATDIHPKDKHIPGDRLALLALARTYGHKIPYTGPRYQGMTVDAGAVHLSFTHAEGGLKSTDGAPLRHFTMAGSDQVFHPATATIQGEQITVTCDRVEEPVAVRYAWTAWPEGGVNFANGQELPAAPFRTDTWAFPALEEFKNALHPDTAARVELPGSTRHVYKVASGWELNLYAFSPPDLKPGDRRPGAVFFFGGGWNGGTPAQFETHCRYLARRGMVAVVADYRVKSRQNTPPIACVEDGRSAVRWLRQHAAELGLDPNRLAAGGGSAGGHVASATGMLDGIHPDGEDESVSSKPNALLLFNPVYDNGPDGWAHSRVQEYWEDISPAHNITADDPPAIVFLGTKDSLIPVSTAERFRDNMKDVGLASELHLYEGQPHGFFNFGRSEGNEIWKDTVRKMDAFLVQLGWLQGAPDETLLLEMARVD